MLFIPERRGQQLGELGFNPLQEARNAASAIGGAVKGLLGGGIIGQLRANISKLGKAAVVPIVAPTVATVKAAQAAAPLVRAATTTAARLAVPLDRSPEKVARIVAPIIAPTAAAVKVAAPIIKAAAPVVAKLGPVVAPVTAATLAPKTVAPVAARLTPISKAITAAVAPVLAPTVAAAAAAKNAPAVVKAAVKPVVAPVAVVARAVAPQGAVSKLTEKVVHVNPETAKKIVAAEALVAGSVVAPAIVGATKAAAATTEAALKTTTGKIVALSAAQKALKSGGSPAAAQAALTQAGLSPETAALATSALSAGHTAEQALALLRGVGGGGSLPALSVPGSQSLTEGPLSPEEAKAQFSSWLANWKPDLYNRLSAGLPSVTNAPLGGFGDEGFDADLGDISSTLTEWANTIQSVAAKVVPALQDVNTIKVQLDRAKNGYPPLPTAQAQAIAAQQRAAGGISPTTLALGGVAVLGAVYIMTRPRRRRR